MLHLHLKCLLEKVLLIPREQLVGVAGENLRAPGRSVNGVHSRAVTVK